MWRHGGTGDSAIVRPGAILEVVGMPLMLREARRKLKFRALARFAGSDALAVGWLQVLWHATADSEPDGGIGRQPDAVIEAELGWPGPPGELIAKLVELRWLDEVPRPARLYVHDWHEYADHGTHRKLARKGIRFANGMPPKLYTLATRVEREEREAFYASPESLRGLEANGSHEPARAGSTPAPAPAEPPDPEAEPAAQHEVSTKPRKAAEPLPAWVLRLADLLIELVTPVPGARVPGGARLRWGIEILRMTREIPEIEKLDEPGREKLIEFGIRWAFGPDNLGGEYEVVVRSGASLREKWPQLVSQARRKGAKAKGKEELQKWATT